MSKPSDVSLTLEASNGFTTASVTIARCGLEPGRDGSPTRLSAALEWLAQRPKGKGS